MKTDINNLTYGQLKEIAGMFSAERSSSTSHDAIPVVVCTDKRGVVFGYCSDTSARPIKLARARMCLYWSADVGGVFGLSDKGPTDSCKISATLPEIVLEGVTAIFTVDPVAEKAWINTKTQGR